VPNNNREGALRKFHEWLTIFGNNSEDPRTCILNEEIRDLDYQIDPGTAEPVEEIDGFQIFRYDHVCLLDFLGDIVEEVEDVLFLVPMEFRPQVTGVESSSVSKSSSEDLELERKALYLASEKFLVWLEKFQYACVDRDLEYIENELDILGYKIERGESTLYDRNPSRQVFRLNFVLLKNKKTNIPVFIMEGVFYNAPPFYTPEQPDCSDMRPTATPDSSVPHKPNLAPTAVVVTEEVFTEEELRWLRGYLS